METTHKDKPKKKSILLFSGGMDSLMYNYLLNPDILYYVKHGNRYEQMELDCIQELIDKGIIDKNKVMFDELPLDKYERDDFIIPNRNLYLITKATHLGETIYLGSVKGDRTLDKSIDFFKKCEGMFNYLWQEQHWCEKRQFNICAPFKHLTKAELVDFFLSKGGKAEHLFVSKSCYNGDNCGECKPCVRKYIALEYNDISTKGYFKHNPNKVKWLLELKDKIVIGEYRGIDEDKEISKVMKWKFKGDKK